MAIVSRLKKRLIERLTVFWQNRCKMVELNKQIYSYPFVVLVRISILASYLFYDRNQNTWQRRTRISNSG